MFETNALVARTFFFALFFEFEDTLMTFATEKITDAQHEIKRLQPRTQGLKAVNFNLNILSDQECLIKFRFTKALLCYIANVLPWSYPTEKNRYMCAPVTAL